MPAKSIEVSEQKKFYTRGTLRGTRISRLAKILTLYCEGELRKGLFIRVAYKGRGV